MTDDAKKKILTYLLLAFALSSIFYYLILAPNHGKLSRTGARTGARASRSEQVQNRFQNRFQGLLEIRARL